jgi:phosphoserine phosphatase
MSFVLTIVTNPSVLKLDDVFLNRVIQTLERKGGRVQKLSWLGEDRACDIFWSEIEAEEAYLKISERLKDAPCDWLIQPVLARKKKLLISDMDSTIIGQECIDELADKVGIKAKVAEITERAMCGELDFNTALNERVALLKDLPEAALLQVYQERIRLNKGAECLVKTMAANGAKCVLVSGGFTFFTEKVAQEAGFHAQHANELEISAGKLTGNVQLPILDKQSKVEFLRKYQTEQNLDAAEIIALGDGANDLPMLQAAGLGVAYYAKPALQEVLRAQINYTDLTAALFFQGYAENEWVGKKNESGK